MHLAAQRHLEFGSDILYPYGPLGFLEAPQTFYGTTTILATIVSAAIYAGLAAALVHLGRRLLPLWAAVIVALVVCRALFLPLKPPEALQALIFVGCVEAVLSHGADERHDRRRDAVIAAAGVAAAVALLGKANVGAFTFVMLLVTAMCVARPAWRGAAVFVAATALAGLVLFLATGQSASVIPAFVSGMVEVIRGYSEAMVVETPPAHVWYYVAFAAGVVILIAIGWAAARGSGRRRTIGLVAVGAALAFAEWKTGFTRNGVPYAFPTAVVALFPLASRLPRSIPLRRPIVAGALVALLVPALVVTNVGPLSILNVRASLRNVAGTALAFLPSRQDAARERTSAQLRALLDVPDDAVAALTGQSVHVEQWETTVMAAYPEFRWAPLPSIQAYAAWTTVLDELNADVLRSADAPTRILRERLVRPDGQLHAVDRRFAWFEEPAATLEMLCRYRELTAGDRWQVLGRTDASCGSARPFATVTAKAGETVAVPPSPDPDQFVIVRITGFPDDLATRLRTALFRAEEWWIELGGRARFRFVPGTADDGLILAVPPAVAFDERFAFGPPITSLTLTQGHEGNTSDDELTYEFLTVPLRADATGG